MDDTYHEHMTQRAGETAAEGVRVKRELNWRGYLRWKPGISLRYFHLSLFLFGKDNNHVEIQDIFQVEE